MIDYDNNHAADATLDNDTKNPGTSIMRSRGVIIVGNGASLN